MADQPDLKAIQALLREGKVQEADDAISKQLAAAEAPPASESSASPPTPAPRPAAAILVDVLDEITAHLGNRPRVAHLVAEFRAAVEKKES